MTNRERWIIYPLLFLAIGLSLRSGIVLDSLQQQPTRLDATFVDADAIQCRTLQVVGKNGKPVVVLTADSTNGAGLIETGTETGLRQAVLQSTPGGATLRLFDRDGHYFAILGHERQTTGLFVLDTQTGQIIPLTQQILRTPDDDDQPDDEPTEDPSLKKKKQKQQPDEEAGQKSAPPEVPSEDVENET